MKTKLILYGWLLIVLTGSPAKLLAQTGTAAAPPDPTAPQLVLDIKTPAYITAIAFAPDGKTVATTGWDAAVTLWDTQTGQARQTLNGLGSPGTALAFSPDGKLIACAASNIASGVVVIWDAPTGALQRTLKAPGRAYTGLAFSPDGHLLATSSGRGVKMQPEAATGLKPNDELVGEALLWDVVTGALKSVLSWDGNQMWSLAFAPDGKTLATGGREETRLWDVATGELKQRLDGRDGVTTSLAFFAGGRMLMGAQQGAPTRIWDVNTGAVEDVGGWQGAGAGNHARMIAISPDEKLVANATPNEPVGVWDLATRKMKWSLRGHTRATLAVAFAPDGKLLASGGEDSVLKLWRIK